MGWDFTSGVGLQANQVPRPWRGGLSARPFSGPSTCNYKDAGKITEITPEKWNK